MDLFSNVNTLLGASYCLGTEQSRGWVIRGEGSTGNFALRHDGDFGQNEIKGRGKRQQEDGVYSRFLSDVERM